MSIRKSITTKLITFVSIFFISSCITIQSVEEVERGTVNNLSKRQKLLVSAALDACDLSYNDTLTFKSKEFNNDCSGLINGIFWAAGVDLLKETSSETGNGVKRIHSLLKKKGLLHKNKLPNEGDLIFWSNTYGSWGNNPLSHIGIVVSVDKKSGSIDYVHNNTYLGDIRRETMNLYKPHEKRPTNNYMRYDNKYKKTAAELFDSFGIAWKL